MTKRLTDDELRMRRAAAIERNDRSATENRPALRVAYLYERELKKRGAPLTVPAARVEDADERVRRKRRDLRAAQLRALSYEGPNPSRRNVENDPHVRSQRDQLAAAERLAVRAHQREHYSAERSAAALGVPFDERGTVTYVTSADRDVYQPPLDERGFDASGLPRDVPLRYHTHRHASPSHHVGPCDAACRAGLRSHAHRADDRESFGRA